MSTSLSLLADPRVRAVWLGETLNAFGNGLTFWALAWLLYRTYPGQPLLTALVLAVLSVSTVLGSLALGAWLDTWDRRRVLTVVNLLLALFTALVPAVIRMESGSLPLLVLIGVVGLLRGLPGPALSASLPGFVPPARFLSLTALFNLTWMTGELLAPAVAGLLISVVGAASVLWIDAGTYLVAACIYAFLRFPPQPQVEATTESGLRAWWVQLRAGWRFVGTRPALWGLFLGLGAVNAFSETFGALILPRVGERLLGAVRGPGGVGLLDSLSVGAEMLASLWLGKQAISGRWTQPLIALGCALPVLGAVGIVLAPSYAVALGFTVLNGLAYAPLSVLASVFVVQRTPEVLRGRVSSVRFAFGNGGRPLAMTAAGALLPLLGLGPLAVLLASVTLLLTGFGYWRGRQDEAAVEAS